MSARSALCLALLAGCGRVGFDDVSRDHGDAGIDGVDGAGAIDAASCVPSGWGTPKLQALLKTNDNDWEPTLHPNGLVMVYTRSSAGDSDLWVATRASTTADFGTPIKVPAASNGATYEYGPVWSPNGKYLTYHFDDGISVNEARVLEYFGGTTFSSSPAVANLPSGSFSWEFTPDDLEVFYTTNASMFDADIRHATRVTTSSPWVVDDAVDDLVRVGPSEGWPAYDAARGILYVERDESSVAVIVEATRSGPNARFEITGPAAISPGVDGDPDLSDDGLTMMFSSIRNGGGSLNDIYVVTRTCQ